MATKSFHAYLCVAVVSRIVEGGAAESIELQTGLIGAQQPPQQLGMTCNKKTKKRDRKRFS